MVAVPTTESGVLPHIVLSLRQKLGRKAKQEPKLLSSVHNCACPRREFSGKPDAGNPHVRFDEGEGVSPFLLYCLCER